MPISLRSVLYMFLEENVVKHLHNFVIEKILFTNFNLISKVPIDDFRADGEN